MTDIIPTAPPLRIAPPPPGWTPQRATPTGPTGMATASLVLGIVAVLFNAFMIPTILAVVFGAIALARGTAGRRRSIVGIVLGALGIGMLFLWAVLAVPFLLGAQHAAIASSVESSITAGIEAKGLTVTGVACPPVERVAAGVGEVCTATTSTGQQLHVEVTFMDTRGGFTYRVVAA